MAAIQTALSGRWLKSLFTTVGDIAYASGVSTPARLAIGSTGQVLKVAGGLPTWANGSPSTTTSTMAGGPPGSPADGDVWIATAVDANGTRWAFQYNAGSASTFKWEFLGGGAIVVDVAPALSLTVVSTITAVASASFTAVRAGDYEADVIAGVANGTGGSSGFEIAPSFAGTNGFQGATLTSIVAGGNDVSQSMIRLLNVAAGNAIQTSYFQQAQPFTLNRLVLRIRPIRVA